MLITVGLGELLGTAVVLCGAGWTLLILTFNQFERRLDEKFLAQAKAAEAEKKTQDDKFKSHSDQLQKIEHLASEVKRLENDILRRDSINITRSEFEKVSEKIFAILHDISEKVTNQAIAHAKGGQ